MKNPVHTHNLLPLEGLLLTGNHWQHLFFAKLPVASSPPTYRAVIEDLVGQLQARATAHELPTLVTARARALFQFNATGGGSPNADDLAYAEMLMQAYLQAAVPVAFEVRNEPAHQSNSDGALFVFESPYFPEKAWNGFLAGQPGLCHGVCHSSVSSWALDLQAQLTAAMHGRTSGGFKVALIHVGLSPVRMAEFGRLLVKSPAQLDALASAAVPAPANPELALFSFGLAAHSTGADGVRIDWAFATDAAGEAAALDFGSRFAFARGRWWPGLLHSKRMYLDENLAPRLKEIWGRYAIRSWTHDADGPLKPLHPVYLKKEAVVVLGLNPSYNPEHRGLDWYEADYTSKGYFKRVGAFMNEAARKSDALGKEVQNGFLTALEWTHLDLLYMRTTSQQQLLKDLRNLPQAAAFVGEQLQLTKEVLAEAQPALLVVANGFGKELTGFEYDPIKKIKEWMGLQFAPEPGRGGVFRITGSTTDGKPDGPEMAGLIGVPVVFTGSFAGTNIRSKEKDEQLTTAIAALHCAEGEAHFKRIFDQ